MDNIDFVIFEIVPVIFLVLIFLIWRFNKRVGKGSGSKKSQGNPPFNSPTKKIEEPRFMQSSENYTFCPYCNTKVMKVSARHCQVCHTRTICPKCRKCVNKDQHRGI